MTGHYRACVSDFDYVGLVLNQSTRVSGADFNYARNSQTQVSVDEFETALSNYVLSYETTLNNAKTTYEQVKNDQSLVIAAKNKAVYAKKAYKKS